MASSTNVQARRIVDADRELSEHFTSAVGGKAQRYEPAIASSDFSPEESIMAAVRSKARRQYAIVEATLAKVPSANRHLVRLVYSHGTDALSDALDEDGRPLAEKPTGLITGKNNSPDPFGLLRVALSPTWGHGSFLRMAVGQDRALRAFGKRHKGAEPTHHAVLDFLAYEAGRGDASAGMLAELRNECQEARDAALGVFATVRSERVEQAKVARDAAEAAEVRAAEDVRERTRKAVSERRIPACLRMTEEQRDRYRRAALAVIEASGADGP